MKMTIRKLVVVVAVSCSALLGCGRENQEPSDLKLQHELADAAWKMTQAGFTNITIIAGHSVRADRAGWTYEAASQLWYKSTHSQ